jgi:pyrroloquinoline quinone biosynthesis protein E
VPDYHGQRPKKCMNGWGNIFLTVTPDGTALPCHTAKMLPGLVFPNVKSTPVDEIWHASSAFNAYRGDAWMKPLCRTCPEKEQDLGGCRCQAYLLTQDASNADPVCSLSPHRHLIDAALNEAERGIAHEAPLVFRRALAS